MTPDARALLPCPCCGSSDVMQETLTSSSGRSSMEYISCNRCEISGGLDSWNRRSPPVNGSGDADLIRAAFLRQLQFENECDEGATGKPCHAQKCGCEAEMLEYIEEARSALPPLTADKC